MIKKINNKKAIAPVFIFLILFAVIIGVYLLLYIPIPAFTKVRTIINFFLILIFWFLLQGFLIYGYFQLGKLAYKGYNIYQTKVKNLTQKAKNYFEFK